MRFLFAIFIILAASAGAQTAKLPDAPLPHHFLDTRNSLTFAGYATAVVMDSVSTQRFTAVGIHELNPMARPFVGSRTGQAFISALGYGTVVGTCYVAHRRGWHRVERWIPVAIGITEMYLTINNYKLVRHATAPARVPLPDGAVNICSCLRRCYIPDYIRYYKSIAAEFDAVKDRVRTLVEHWPTDGGWKEAILRAVLRRHLPNGTFVGTGFVVGRDRHSSQIDLMVLKPPKPMLFHEGDVAIVAAEAPAIIVEVKTGLAGPAAWSEALLKLARNGALCRDIAQNQVWLGLFAYDGGEAQANNILDALHHVRRETQIPINCVCAGDSLFVRYWPAGQIERGDDVADDGQRNRWRAYGLRGLAPSYFISNLIDSVCELDREETDYVWFALAEGKRRALIAERAAD